MNALSVLTVATLWQREIVRFFRQSSRVMGALGTPLIFWFFVGSGIGYSHFFFPGALLLMILFTSIFSTISVIEDRREGFLQSALISPAPRWGLVLGKVLGGATVAMLQGFLFLALTPWAGIRLSALSFLAAGAGMFAIAFSLTSLGFWIAWKFRSVQGFHAVINLFLFPLWILSGAVFPAEKSASWIHTVMTANPLAYGMAVLRLALMPREAAASGLFSAGPSWVMTLAFGAFFFVLASRAALKRSDRDYL